MTAYQLYANPFGTNPGGGNHITITADYQVNFLTDFFVGNDLIGKKAVMLYFDPETDEVAFVFQDEKMPDSWRIGLATNGKRNNGHIHPKSFFKRNGLRGKIVTGRYGYKLSDINGEKAFVVKLERLKQESKP